MFLDLRVARKNVIGSADQTWKAWSGLDWDKNKKASSGSRSLIVIGRGDPAWKAWAGLDRGENNEANSDSRSLIVNAKSSTS